MLDDLEQNGPFAHNNQRDYPNELCTHLPALSNQNTTCELREISLRPMFPKDRKVERIVSSNHRSLIEYHNQERPFALAGGFDSRSSLVWGSAGTASNGRHNITRPLLLFFA